MSTTSNCQESNAASRASQRTRRRRNRLARRCLIDVLTGKTVVRGLSMRHSRRLYGGRLWVVNSGRGGLCLVDPQRGRVETVAALPLYTRGFACRGPYAIVKLSKIREKSVFGGLPILEHPDQRRCGVGVIELATGRTVASLQFHLGVEEIFAVDVLPGVQNPKLCGPTLAEEQRGKIWRSPPHPSPTSQRGCLRRARIEREPSANGWAWSRIRPCDWVESPASSRARQASEKAKHKAR
jgi:uncharacterized protein (TIGR03032 family)